MSNAVEPTAQRAKINSRWLAAIDRLLIAGMQMGTSGKRDAINKVLRLVPKWTRGDCWRRIRRLRKMLLAVVDPEEHPSSANAGEPQSAESIRRPSYRRWTPSEDNRLLNWAGYEPVKKIAQRLGRSERAVRFRMGALSMSAKVTDGWSQRSLRALLRVSPARLRYLIGKGILRVRDPRVSMESIAAFCEKNRASLDQTVIQAVTAAKERREEACSWERTADLLGLAVEQVQDLICSSKLSVFDPFVTDRSFEEFCRKHRHEINLALIDPATRGWLMSEYGVADCDCQRVSRAQKHAVVIRTCKCGRSIAGNVYFKHVRHCRIEGEQKMREAV